MAFLLDTWSAEFRVYSLAVSLDGTRLAAGGKCQVMVWDLDTGQRVLGPLAGHSDCVDALAFSPDGLTLASGSEDRSIRIWSTKDGESIFHIAQKQPEVEVWSPTPLALPDPNSGHDSCVTCVMFSHDGHFLVSGSGDGSIRLWDTQTWKQAKKLYDVYTRVTSLAVSLDDTRVFGAYNDGTVRAYDTADGSVLFRCVCCTKDTHWAALSVESRRIIVAFDSDAVHILDGAAGYELSYPVAFPTGTRGPFAFSHNSRYIAAESREYTIQIWDVETGTTKSGPLSGHTDIVRALAFTPDGTRLITGSDDRTIKIWDVSGLGIQTKAAEEPSLTRTESLSTEITSATTPEQVVSQLAVRGCPNMTHELDWSSCTDNPVSRGGFGDVYRCRLKSGTEVAVKTIRPYLGSSDKNQKHLKHAAREIYTWTKCRHPNVQRLLGLVMVRGQLGMITRWEMNGSLPQYLEQTPGVDRCVLSTQMAEGLAYLHVSGVVHGDLKGANVLVSAAGIAQLSDFGNSTLQDYTLQFSNNSIKEGLSPRWAAPELFKGGKCNMHTDVYALGMTILEAITGQVPWAGKGDHTVLFAVVVDKAHPERPEVIIPSYSEHGDALWSILERCWEFEAKRRPSAEEVKTLIKTITQVGLRSREVEMADADSS